VLVRVARFLSTIGLAGRQRPLQPQIEASPHPCSDGAGEVVAVGEGVSLWKIGDRVAAIFMQNWLDDHPPPPSPSRSRRRHRRHVDRIHRPQGIRPGGHPEHLSFQEAATLPCAAVTAWNALSVGDIKPEPPSSSREPAASPSCPAACPPPRCPRHRISSSFEKLERAYSLGLDAGLDYKETPSGTAGHSTKPPAKASTSWSK